MFLKRKWLTTPVRKLSQGKFDRSAPSSTIDISVSATTPPVPSAPIVSSEKQQKNSKSERKTGKFSALKVSGIQFSVSSFTVAYKCN